MRDRLIELLCEIKCKGEDWRDGGCALRKDERCIKIDNLDMCMIGCIADNLLANGVIVLPCKVGQTVYVVSRYYTGTWEVFEGKIDEITMYEKNIFMRIKAKGNFKFADEVSQIGKCVFFSHEEAKKARAERSAE